jgi:hypothetical protein
LRIISDAIRNTARGPKDEELLDKFDDLDLIISNTMPAIAQLGGDEVAVAPRFFCHQQDVIRLILHEVQHASFKHASNTDRIATTDAPVNEGRRT